MTKPDSQDKPASTPEQLISPAVDAAQELPDQQLDAVTGGGGKVVSHEITQDVTVNKAKTADKAFNAMDGYIRG